MKRKSDQEIERVMSSFIDEVRYDIDMEELEILFNSGAVYKYDNVPEDMFLDFIDSISKGTFFNVYIRNNVVFPYMRVSDLLSNIGISITGSEKKTEKLIERLMKEWSISKEEAKDKAKTLIKLHLIPAKIDDEQAMVTFVVGDIAVGSPTNITHHDAEWRGLTVNREYEVLAMGKDDNGEDTIQIKDDYGNESFWTVTEFYNKKWEDKMAKLKKKAGMWAMPYTSQHVKELEDILKELDKGQYTYVHHRLYPVFGDDGLFDDIVTVMDKITKPLAKVIRKNLKGLIERYKKNPKDYKHQIEDSLVERLERSLKPMTKEEIEKEEKRIKDSNLPTPEKEETDEIDTDSSQNHSTGLNLESKAANRSKKVDKYINRAIKMIKKFNPERSEEEIADIVETFLGSKGVSVKEAVAAFDKAKRKSTLIGFGAIESKIPSLKEWKETKRDFIQIFHPDRYLTFKEFVEDNWDIYGFDFDIPRKRIWPLKGVSTEELIKKLEEDNIETKVWNMSLEDFWGELHKMKHFKPVPANLDKQAVSEVFEDFSRELDKLIGAGKAKEEFDVMYKDYIGLKDDLVNHIIDNLIEHIEENLIGYTKDDLTANELDELYEFGKNSIFPKIDWSLIEKKAKKEKKIISPFEEAKEMIDESGVEGEGKLETYQTDREVRDEFIKAEYIFTFENVSNPKRLLSFFYNDEVADDLMEYLIEATAVENWIDDKSYELWNSEIKGNTLIIEVNYDYEEGL